MSLPRLMDEEPEVPQPKQRNATTSDVLQSEFNHADRAEAVAPEDCFLPMDPIQDDDVFGSSTDMSNDPAVVSKPNPRRSRASAVATTALPLPMVSCEFFLQEFSEVIDPDYFTVI